MTVRQIAQVLGVPIDVITWDGALTQLNAWASNHESRYVCICNVHSVVTASRDAEFGRVLREADLATPDGAPVALMLRRLGHVEQQRINGPDLMWRYCELAATRTEPIFLYGSSEETLSKLKVKLTAAFPGLNIAGSVSPPFRTLTPEEDTIFVDQINSSGAVVVFVSLGCPKQEMWMAAHRGKINTVMIGVGAAFDYHAGTLKRAPKWMQNNGLEWLHRLLSEPRRLWKRYLVTNTLFVLGAGMQLMREIGNGRTKSVQNDQDTRQIIPMEKKYYLSRFPFRQGDGKTRFCIMGEMTEDTSEDFKLAISTISMTDMRKLPCCADCTGDLGWSEIVYGVGARNCMQCGSVFLVYEE
jgi:N-acetylglucosaminyldiphosphoundecaprenol N-acetyl-beta-D-mannosaminyltransferase